jgi:hypothetical protein
MIYKKISKGIIEFKGIDNWNQKEISGIIVYQPYDVKLNQVWGIKFYNIDGNILESDTAFRAESAKKCKEWLTN